MTGAEAPEESGPRPLRRGALTGALLRGGMVRGGLLRGGLDKGWPFNGGPLSCLLSGGRGPIMLDKSELAVNRS